MTEKISVIIPFFNSGRTIEYTLSALGAQTRKNLISEIIIADASNNGAEMKRIQSTWKDEKIRVVKVAAGTIPATSRNIAAGYARGEILAFVDADAYPAPDWLENIVKAYENNCLVGGGAVEIPDFQKDKPIAWSQYYLQFNEYMPVGEARIKNFVSGCNTFCDKKLFQRAGGFPEIRASEDVLFGLGMSKMANLWFIPGAKVYHVFREDWKRFLRNQMLLGRYIFVYRKRYYQHFIYKGVMPLVLLPAFLCVKLFRIISRISQAGWYHRYRFVTVITEFLFGLLFWGIGFMGGIFR